MKLSAQEEYGLRCLLRVASAERSESVTIPAIAEAEGLSIPYVGKLMSVLRQGQFVDSVRGQTGGFLVSPPPEKIGIPEGVGFLCGRPFSPRVFVEFVRLPRVCTPSLECFVRF